MKSAKWWIEMIMAVSLGFGCLLEAAMAQVDTVDGISWTYWSYDGESTVDGGRSWFSAIPTSTAGAISIPLTLGGCPVTSIGAGSFRGCSNLTSVTIPDSVTNIGAYAFSSCGNLTNMVLPNKLTSIEERTFNGCSNMTSVTIGNCVTKIGGYAFYDCISLTNVAIPLSVTNIEEFAFSYCSSLTSITIPDSVISIGKSALLFWT